MRQEDYYHTQYLRKLIIYDECTRPSFSMTLSRIRFPPHVLWLLLPSRTVQPVYRPDIIPIPAGVARPSEHLAQQLLQPPEYFVSCIIRVRYYEQTL